MPRITNNASGWKRAVVTSENGNPPLSLITASGFGGVHFVDLSMQSAAADAELFRCGGDVAIRGRKRLDDQSFFGFVQIERARLFAEKLELKLRPVMLLRLPVAQPSANRAM